MLELKDVSLTIDHDGEELALLDEVSIKIAPRHFMAIVGPSGCGKTTILKVIAGLSEHTEGNVFWSGRDLDADGDFEPSEVAYVPQFSIAYDQLTVWESVEAAVRLRVRTRTADQVEDIVTRVLKHAGMSAIEDRQVKVLSGGQKRRLALAMELVADPDLLLCDEVTSGLDPKSERDIVRLLHQLSREGDQRLVVNVTHSLSNLELYDSVLVLYEGRVVFHGPPTALKHYFSVDSAEDVYPRLGKRDADDWKGSWLKVQKDYYQSLAERAGIESWEYQLPKDEVDEEVGRESEEEDTEHDEKVEEEEEVAELPPKPGTPGFFVQVAVLLARRWKIFLRDKGQVAIHLAMLLGFPLLVVVFALDGIDPPMNAPTDEAGNLVEQYQLQTKVAEQHLSVGGLVSGLIMFQVILLTLMGSNNSAREIASERSIYEKERFAGLRPLAYLGSKILFLVVFVFAQAVWMSVFVELVVGDLPGHFETRLLLLLLVNAAMTAVCLGISAMMKTPEQATLLSIYLVGFQLPLSGAVLALPGWLEPIVQPLIAAYWSWSGSLSAMAETSFYDCVKAVTETAINPASAGFTVLGLHLLVGLIVAFIGCRRSQWEH